MNIALLGGSFDPPHLGHSLIARQVIERVGIDEVWLLPMYSTNAHAAIFQKNLSPVENRVAMAKLLEEDRISVSDFEINHNKKSITILTLELLKQQYPEHTFYWITGSDKLATFQQYDRWQDIIFQHHLIVFPREHMLWHIEERVKEAFAVQEIPQNVTVLHDKSLVLTNISSTLIRKRAREGRSITDLVSKRVEEYIVKHGLYR
jgi:nicotinate-nucleotide adenylyltransferase